MKTLLTKTLDNVTFHVVESLDKKDSIIFGDVYFDIGSNLFEDTEFSTFCDRISQCNHCPLESKNCQTLEGSIKAFLELKETNPELYI